MNPTLTYHTAGPGFGGEDEVNGETILVSIAALITFMLRVFSLYI